MSNSKFIQYQAGLAVDAYLSADLRAIEKNCFISRWISEHASELRHLWNVINLEEGVI